jgi:hypothetical protein
MPWIFHVEYKFWNWQIESLFTLEPTARDVVMETESRYTGISEWVNVTAQWISA